MKLAEALLERADLQTKINVLQSRLCNNARIQEGTEPNEKPELLLKELDEKIERLQYLIVHINKTNAMTTGKSGETIAELIAKRDVLLKKFQVLGNFIDSGNDVISRISHAEIRTLPTFKVADMQKKLDKLSQQIRQIDAGIQELNWLTELI